MIAFFLSVKFRISHIFVSSTGVPCLRYQTQKQAENIPIDGVLSYKFLGYKFRKYLIINAQNPNF